jgi:hypothetical protein
MHRILTALYLASAAYAVTVFLGFVFIVCMIGLIDYAVPDSWWVYLLR